MIAAGLSAAFQGTINIKRKINNMFFASGRSA